MRYIAIRDTNHEIVGLAELPDNMYARRVYRHPDIITLTATEISEPEYTSYIEFELAPVFSWIPSPEKKLADIYDPEFFHTDGTDVYQRKKDVLYDS